MKMPLAIARCYVLKTEKSIDLPVNKKEIDMTELIYSFGGRNLYLSEMYI